MPRIDNRRRDDNEEGSQHHGSRRRLRARCAQRFSWCDTPRRDERSTRVRDQGRQRRLEYLLRQTERQRARPADQRIGIRSVPRLLARRAADHVLQQPLRIVPDLGDERRRLQRPHGHERQPLHLPGLLTGRIEDRVQRHRDRHRRQPEHLRHQRRRHRPPAADDRREQPVPDLLTQRQEESPSSATAPASSRCG